MNFLLSSNQVCLGTESTFYVLLITKVRRHATRLTAIFHISVSKPLAKCLILHFIGAEHNGVGGDSWIYVCVRDCRMLADV